MVKSVQICFLKLGHLQIFSSVIVFHCFGQIDNQQNLNIFRDQNRTAGKMRQESKESHVRLRVCYEHDAKIANNSQEPLKD